MYLNIKGNLIDFTEPKVLAIINITEDSFYSESRVVKEDALLKKAEVQLAEGAFCLDIGAQSTRPGANQVDEQMECLRVKNAVQLLKKTFPKALLSVDTFRTSVAEVALSEGAEIINDISSGSFDAEMMSCVAKHNAVYIMMHQLGSFSSMHQVNTEEDILTEVQYFFGKKIKAAYAAGIKEVIIDPGFGFSKTLAQNYRLLNNLNLLQQHKVPVLVGISRKSMLYKPLGITADEALNATSVAHSIALMQGAQILRVHDVKPAVEAIKITQLAKQG